VPSSKPEDEPKPWYAGIKDEHGWRAWSLNPKVGGLICVGFLFLGIWLAFGLPLFFESPHSVGVICRGYCESFTPQQYGEAQEYYTGFYGVGGAVLLALGFGTQRSLNRAEDRKVPSSESTEKVGEWSECMRCGGPLETAPERETRICQGCRVLPA
jgi:hypothetical protein